MRNASGDWPELMSAADFPPYPGVIEETGSDYEENALIKARAWANFTGIPAIADDSGLEVRALEWGPGIFSARAAPGSDSDRIKRLLEGIADTRDRFARFVACIAVAFPASGRNCPCGRRNFFSAQGVCRGNIARYPSGSAGFGYDPVFVPHGYDATFAELGSGVKSKISHRAKSLRGIALMLPSVIKYIGS
jgi:XTP/dITP diphosphohydrolase